MKLTSPRHIALILSLLPFATAWAQQHTTAPIAAPDMHACKSRWQTLAHERGLNETTRSQLIPKLEYLPRVLELDRRQPEFSSTFSNYLNRRVTDTRIEKGQALLQQNRALLDQLTIKYGVPQHILVAFWGLETNYGGYLGDTSTLDALATLGCDERRSRYFTAELMNALSLVETHQLDPAHMRGSWAGAMGHTQFMPSNYRRYGVDGDGDGRVDLWQSTTDALTSAANFLEQLGWKKDQRWGREVNLPDDFDYRLAGIKSKRPLSEWQRLGVRHANGGRLPIADFEAALIVPAGHTGPAFLVYHNFRIIMRWNNSQAYALSVGLLADRIMGAAPLTHPPQDELARISRSQIMALQSRLNELGFDAGQPDGIAGSGTRAAIRAFQASRDMIADGYHSAQVFRALDVPMTVEP